MRYLHSPAQASTRVRTTAFSSSWLFAEDRSGEGTSTTCEEVAQIKEGHRHYVCTLSSSWLLAEDRLGEGTSTTCGEVR